MVNCTVSNLKLASGIAPLNTLMKAGVNVCLGTDGASSNNNLSLFEEMKVTAIVQKNAYHTPAAFSADQIWQIATENAYRAFGMNMGLFEGAQADLALIDLKENPGSARRQIFSRSRLQHDRRSRHYHCQWKGPHARGSHTRRGGNSGKGSGAIHAFDLLTS